MRKIATLACCLALAACSGMQLAATATKTALPADQVARLQGICTKAQPLLDVVVAIPSAKDYAIDAQAYCKELNAGVVPPTTDTNTLSWLPSVIKVAAQVAGFVIPLL